MKNKSSEDIDKDLIDEIKKGDTNAFKQMVEKYKDVSLSLICSIIKDKNLAEDILQRVFITVYEKIHTFKHKSSFSTWLYRLTLNLSYNELKKIRKSTTFENMGTLPEELISREDLLEQENQKKYINLALNAMKTNESMVLRLFYLSEMSITEITKITGFSKSKVKVNLHRGRDNLDFQLRQLLGNELKDLL